MDETLQKVVEALKDIDLVVTTASVCYPREGETTWTLVVKRT